MFAASYFAPDYFAPSYFAETGAAPVHSGDATICPPVTPNWSLLNITSDMTARFVKWEAPESVNDKLES